VDEALAAAIKTGYPLLLSVRLMSSATQLVDLEFVLPPQLSEAATYELEIAPASGSQPSPEPFTADEEGRVRYVARATDLKEGSTIKLRYKGPGLYVDSSLDVD
jgi:hypothetical protein